MRFCPFFVAALIFCVLMSFPVCAQFIPTPGNPCTTGESAFWEQGGICVSSVWQRPAFQFGATTQSSCATSGAGTVQWTGSALELCNGSSWVTFTTGGSTTITLGTAASSTNPQRSGEIGTGLFSANSGQVSVAVSETGTGTEVGRWTATGLNIIAPVTTSTDEPSLQINGNNAIWQDATNYNVAVGPTAFPATVSYVGGPYNGQLNTAVGYQALNANATGNGNTAVGYKALAANTTGYNNTAVGQGALAANTTGIYNTAVGAYGMLSNNTTGTGNTAVGSIVLTNNTAGSTNTGVGYQNLYENTTGSNNVAVGPFTMYSNTTGGNNTALGGSAMGSNTTGSNNTALGYRALQANTTGTNNVAIGYQVGNTTLSTGSNNILIGTSSAVDTPSATSNYYLNIGQTIYGTMTAGTGGTALTIGTTSDDGAIMTFAGEGAITLPAGTTAQRPSAVNGMIRYNSTTNAMEGYINGAWVSLTTSSDARLKTDIVPLRNGLDIVEKLKPVYFDWDQKNPRARSFGAAHQIGFIAQDVEKVLPEVVARGSDSYRTMDYARITAVDTAALQEMQQEIVDLKKEIAALKAAAQSRSVSGSK